MQSLSDVIKAIREFLPHNITSDLKASSGKFRITDQKPSSPAGAPLRDEKARIIQRAWRGFIIKEKLFQNPYRVYMTMMDRNDEKAFLAAIMFGKNIATIIPESEYSLKHPEEGNFYHRDANLDGVARLVLAEHNLAEPDMVSSTDYYFIPITQLRNAETTKILEQFLPLKVDYRIFTSPDLRIGVLAVKKGSHFAQSSINDVIKSFGLVASLWELAENKKRPMSIMPPPVQTARGAQEEAVAKTKEIEQPILPEKHILDNYQLPATIQELKTSSIYRKLLITASRDRYPTNKLSQCLLKLIFEYTGELDKDAIKRIALMADLANTFYVYNYPRYALCVYAIIHEISLSLSKKHPTKPIAEQKEEASEAAAENTRLSPPPNSFHGFMDESKKTLLTMLGVTKETETTFVASPATSGTNAYFLAQDLAHKMTIQTGEKAKIFIVKPSYYEFDRVSKTTMAVDAAAGDVTTEHADIFMVSAGPIFSAPGLYPGTDINRFVTNNIMTSPVKKHRTIVIDATTALYKNIKLNPEVLGLVESGMLSIIIHESHQKFGLIHSDQAQYGRMFGLFSTSHSNQLVLQTFQQQAEQDFNEHIDMRIGAFISQACGPILEKIKEQHFSNGALFTQILNEALMINQLRITDTIKKHPDMLENMSELYFVPIPPQKKIKAMIQKRDSFGHFSSTLTTFSLVGARLSPDASDKIDCLMQAVQLYLTKDYDSITLADLLIKARPPTSPPMDCPLSLTDQITLMAIMNTVVVNQSSLDFNHTGPDLIASMSVFIKQCPELNGRPDYQRVRAYLSNLKLRPQLHRLIDYYHEFSGLPEKIKKIGGKFKQLFYRKDIEVIYTMTRDYINSHPIYKLKNNDIYYVLSFFYLSTAALDFRLERGGWYRYVIQHNQLSSLLRTGRGMGNEMIQEEIAGFLLTCSTRARVAHDPGFKTLYHCIKQARLKEDMLCYALDNKNTHDALLMATTPDCKTKEQMIVLSWLKQDRKLPQNLSNLSYQYQQLPAFLATCTDRHDDDIDAIFQLFFNQLPRIEPSLSKLVCDLDQLDQRHAEYLRLKIRTVVEKMVEKMGEKVPLDKEYVIALSTLIPLLDKHKVIHILDKSQLTTLPLPILQAFFSMADSRKKIELIAELGKKEAWEALLYLEPTRKEIGLEEQGNLVLQIIMVQNEVDFNHLSRLPLQNLLSKVDSTIAESIITQIIQKTKIVNAPMDILELSMAFASEPIKDSLIQILVQDKKYSELCKLMCMMYEDSYDYRGDNFDALREQPQLINHERRE